MSKSSTISKYGMIKALQSLHFVAVGTTFRKWEIIFIWFLLVQILFAYFVKNEQQCVIRGGGDSHMEQTGMLIRNFEFNP